MLFIDRLIQKLRYNKGLISEYALNLLLILSPIIITPVLLNKVGEEQFGLWVSITSFASFFNISSFGFANTLLNEASKSRKSTSEISELISTISFSLLIVFFISTMIFIVAYFNLNSIFAIRLEDEGNVRILAILTYLSVLLVIYSQIFHNILFAFGNLNISNITRSLFLIFQISASILVVKLTDSSLYYLAVINVICPALVLLSLWKISKHYVSYSIKLRFINGNNLKQNFSSSFYFFLLGIAVYIVFYSDNLIIGKFIGLKAVAIYSIIFKLISVANNFLFKFSDILIPSISDYCEKRNYRFIRHLHKLVFFKTLTVSILTYTLLYILGLKIVEFWIGHPMKFDNEVFLVLLIFGFVHSLVHVTSTFVVAMGVHKNLAIISLAEALLNVIISLTLLPHLGLMGVALGTLISHVLTNGWYCFYLFNKSTKLQTESVFI